MSPDLHRRDGYTLKKVLTLSFHLLLAFSSTVLLWHISANGIASLPPLGETLNPGTGIWSLAKHSGPSTNETLRFPGLNKPVTILYESNGMAHIHALTDDDLFWSIGYLQSHFRLTQMDLQRRQGEGKLSEILGPSLLDQDEFELSLGLQRSAEADWKAYSLSQPGKRALLSFSQGVNVNIEQEKLHHTLPPLFRLLNYTPQPWTPVDSLVIQEEMAMTLDFTSTPLDYALLVKSLGYERTMQWFPVLALNAQHPYDTGPYQGTVPPQTNPLPAQLHLANTATTAIIDAKKQFMALPPNLLQHIASSNNWAVNGPKAASGKALMAGDPHLDLTLPSIWYQLDANSPGYTFTGVSIPGFPGVLIGQNQHISWSLTDTQNQATLFYLEKEDAAHPDEYYWNGSWRHLQHIRYTIAVKGAAEAHIDVRLTVHGPILPDPRLPGQPLSITWVGSFVSAQLDCMLGILKASNFAQFSASLQKWVAPTLNFVYADQQGNIGMIAPGMYPIIKAGAPWLPLPGTGEADIIGSIPFKQIPHVYNPPSHIVFSANQRPVGKDYPYYIGTTLDFFEDGYRADELYQQLSQAQHLTVKDMEQLQQSIHDPLAAKIIPKLLEVLTADTLHSPLEQQGRAILANWNDEMRLDSSAAAIWWTFWQTYVTDTFTPWWNAAHVPVNRYPSLAISTGLPPMNENVEAWTLTDPKNPAFSLPTGQIRTASDVMREAFQETMTSLAKTKGSIPQQWRWGNLHTSTIHSLLHVNSLGYGPYPSSGDNWTLNAAYGLDSSHGPSYRLIVDWGTKQSEEIYPGGQDENPLHPWYQNQISPWTQGKYYLVMKFDQVQRDHHNVVWELEPA